MAQALDYKKISNSCDRIISIVQKMDDTQSVLKSQIKQISSGWEGIASDSYTKKLDYFLQNFDEAKKTLAMSVLFLSGCADGYKTIDKNVYQTLIGLIGGQSYIDKLDSKTIPSTPNPSTTKQNVSNPSSNSASYSSSPSYNYSNNNYSSSNNYTHPTTYSSPTTSQNTEINNNTKVEYTIPESTYTGPLDMENYPTGYNLKDGLERAVLVAKYLMQNGGFSAVQASAMVGVYVDENYCDPGSYMAAEKNGQGASGTGGNGYGAGIGSWTFESYKNQCLNDAGYPAGTPIESLTLQQQCDMIIAMSQKSNKVYFDALKRCDNIEDAAATASIITGGVGYSSNWDTHPTVAEAKYMSDSYGKANDARFGASPYHWNLYDRRLDYAKEIFKRITSDS